MTTNIKVIENALSSIHFMEVNGIDRKKNECATCHLASEIGRYLDELEAVLEIPNAEIFAGRLIDAYHYECSLDDFNWDCSSPNYFEPFFFEEVTALRNVLEAELAKVLAAASEKELDRKNLINFFVG